jgi:hypothetical protein
MELLLNLAWALLSIGLIGMWLRGSGSNPAPRHLQGMALAVVVLLLLPVISLSDDLMAAQGLAETDTCLRRAHDCDCGHHPVPPVTLPEEITREVAVTGLSCEFLTDESGGQPSSFQGHALFGRPPPSA